MRLSLNHIRTHPIVVAAWLLGSAAISACGGSRVSAAVPAPAPAAPAPAVFAYAPGERHAFFENRATIHVAGDTSTATDTVITRMYATFHLAPAIGTDTVAATATLSGTIDSAAVVAGSHASVGAGTPPLAAPVPFTGTLDGGTVHLDVPAASTTDCESPVGSYLAIASDLIPSLPAHLAVGDSWSETVTHTSCRGGVVLTTSATHTYVVLDSHAIHDSRLATLVGRTTSYRVSGSGAQAGVPVRVEGEGSGKGEILVDVAAGDLLTTTASSTLNLTFEAVGRVQRVVQDGTQHLVITVPLEP